MTGDKRKLEAKEREVEKKTCHRQETNGNPPSNTDWHPVNGYPLYEVNRTGQIRNVNSKKILTPSLSVGYPYVNLCRLNSSPKIEYIHRLIAQTFVTNPNPAKFEIVNHIDGNKLNSTASNLEWCTKKENNAHALRTGLQQCPFCKLIQRPNKL